MNHLRILMVNLAELAIILVSATSDFLWRCIKRTRLAPFARNIYFGISEYLKIRKHPSSDGTNLQPSSGQVLHLHSLQILRCPNCKSKLSISDSNPAAEGILEGTLKCQLCELSFKVANGLPNLIFPVQLDERTLYTEIFYDQRPKYDYRPTAFRMGMWSYAFTSVSRNRRWAEILAVHGGDSVLEVGVGNGNNLPFIADIIGENGRLCGLDVSSGCLKQANARMLHRKPSVELVHGNACYLPYMADAFDAVLCVGGFDDFEDKKKALEEMIRVAKAGAKVVIVDEGLAPDRAKTLLGRYMLRRMNVFANKPPVMYLPKAIKDLKIDWVYQRTCWILEFRKGA